MATKTSLKIELPIKDNTGSNLIIDDIDKDVWKEMKKKSSPYSKKKIYSIFIDLTLKISRTELKLLTINSFPEVPDVCRYKIDISTNSITKSTLTKNIPNGANANFDDEIIDLTKHTPVILLILESPHKDEYDSNFDPITPANGKTGEGIRDSIEKVLNDINVELIKLNKGLIDKYYLIISNPVPYQTSLNYFIGGELNSDLRNKVWRKIWDKKGKDKYFIKKKFEDKIIKYKPDLIINACTGGVDQYSLQSRITDWIKGHTNTKISNIQLVKTYHPSTWNSFGIKIL